MTAEHWIIPEWPAPARVRAFSTLRSGGVSAGPYRSFNLAAHAGDDPAAVAENRGRLCDRLALPAEPVWLRQVHGRTVVEPAGPAGVPPEADAAVTGRPATVCAVLTADCLPVLFADRGGRRVGVAHAGWRGLAAGVLEATIAALGEPAELLAWLGPAIGGDVYEVGDEVRDVFVAVDAQAAGAFRPSAGGRWLADLPQLARQRLARSGVPADRIHGGRWCTYSDPQRFFSFRRDGRCGRMASGIWLVDDGGSIAPP